MLKAYRYQLDLNEHQKDFMNRSFGCARVVYNYCLRRKQTAYQQENTTLSQFDLCKEVVLLKRTDDHKWLNDVAHQTLCCSVQNLDKAFTKFFRDKNGFPNFKSKHNSAHSCQFAQGVRVDFERSRIKIPKLGWVKAHVSRRFEGKTKTTTISKSATGKYFISILVDDSVSLPLKGAVNETTAVGIDVGIKHFAVLSTGEKVDNPKYLESASKRLACLQRRLSRKQKESKRRLKAKVAVAKAHEKVANQRKDFLHKLTSRIISENQTVIIEDLNVGGMLKNHCLAKSISSASWSEFFRQLSYKSEWSGKNLLRIGRFEPSSKMCPCGVVNKDLTLKDREWTCKSCNAIHDRDLLAANNIKRFGLQKQNIRNSGEGIPVEDVEKSALAGSVKR